MSLSDISIKRPKTVMILSLILIALGFYEVRTIPIDTFPDMSLPYVLLTTTYSNASPEEVESKVTKPIESAMSGVSGLKKITSASSNGSSVVLMQFTQETNLDSATNMVRDRLGLVTGLLPTDASSPMIIQMDPALMPIMAVTLVGDKTPDQLLDIAENIVQPAFEQLDGVAQVYISGGRERAINIDVPLNKLEQYDLSLSQIKQMIAAQNWKADAGSVTDHNLEYSISSEGDFTNLEQMRNTVIATKSDEQGNMVQIKLGDIGTVTEGYKDATSYSYVNGQDGVNMAIQKQSGNNSLKIAQSIQTEMKTLETQLPANTHLVVAFNSTDMVQTSIDNVANSAITGAILAVLVILIFLRSLSSTLIISLTIPISLLVTLAIMAFTNHTVNMLSLAGLSLGVGMLVDNSIVILENIFVYKEKGAKPHIAARLGSNEMSRAIIASTLTSICVFLPLLLFRNSMDGLITIFEDLAFTVIISLTCSLVVALVLVPTLSSSIFKGSSMIGKQRSGLNGFIEKSFKGFEKVYSRVVKWALHHKILFLVVVLGLFAATIAKIPSLGFDLFPSQASTETTLTLEFVHGTDIDEINRISKDFESKLQKAIQGYTTISTTIGSNGNPFGGTVASSAQIQITIKNEEERVPGDMDMDTVTDKARELAKQYPQFSLTADTSSSSGFSNGSSSDIDITLKSNDFDRLTTESKKIAQLLETQGADIVTDVQNSIVAGNPQLNLIFDRDKMALLNLNTMSVANELKADMSGTTVGTYTEKGDDIDMILRLSGASDFHSYDLDDLTVTNSLGQKIPLTAFAHFEKATSPMSISRENQIRVAHITATKAGKLSLSEAALDVENLLTKNVITDESLSYSVGGNWETMQEGIDVFIRIILMAAILVFAVMASQFESFKDPFIILFTLPFALIGIIGMALIMKQAISLMTLVGGLVLVGIIVNNGIVLVDYTNLMRKRGRTLENAIVEAAQSRLRPVLMTTMTTVLALVPMAFFHKTGSELVEPIGQTVFGGLTFGTIMTLLIIPIIYYIFNIRGEKKQIKKANERKSKVALEFAQEEEEDTNEKN